MSRLQCDPKVYPKCPTCERAYVLRLGIVIFSKHGECAWAWFRDCKHKTPPVTVDLRKKPAKRSPQLFAFVQEKSKKGNAQP